ncbi:transglutaminase family protein [Alloyangia pacifica]|uniref:transglutaminase family protein n=1 Tax=Alloyangia pacifica TaxID=311180 RepID=UPI0031DF407B
MSQLYDISLRITYEYAHPAGASRTLLRILPRALQGQQLLSGAVTAEPAPSWRRDGKDFFGNPTCEMAHDMPLSEIAFAFSGRVRKARPVAGLDLSGGLGALAQELAGVRSIGPESPHHFLGTSPRLPAAPEIAAFARDTLSSALSVRAAIEAISHRLHSEFAFDPEATEVTTAAIEAFRARRGVCQDISHVMITALRSLGIPAGYVSGFLRTLPPEGQPRLEGADAMHAWVRAWCGVELGWVEIDPTNDMFAGADHVTVAYGRDYSDVAPTRGSLRSEGSHVTTHFVDMVPV